MLLCKLIKSSQVTIAEEEEEVEEEEEAALSELDVASFPFLAMSLVVRKKTRRHRCDTMK